MDCITTYTPKPSELDTVGKSAARNIGHKFACVVDTLNDDRIDAMVVYGIFQ